MSPLFKRTVWGVLGVVCWILCPILSVLIPVFPIGAIMFILGGGFLIKAEIPWVSERTKVLMNWFERKIKDPILRKWIQVKTWTVNQWLKFRNKFFNN